MSEPSSATSARNSTKNSSPGYFRKEEIRDLHKSIFLMLFASNLQYDTNRSLLRVLESDYKDSLIDAIPMGFFFNMIGLMMMTSALQHTLRTLRSMPEKEVDRLLSDREQQGNIIYFNSIEKLADKIIAQVMKDIDPRNVVQ